MQEGSGRASPRAAQRLRSHLSASRRLTFPHQGIRVRRRFRATSASYPRRLPSKRSTTIHRGGTRAGPVEWSRAFASHPCRSSQRAPARHGQLRSAARTDAIRRRVSQRTRYSLDPLASEPANSRYPAPGFRASAATDRRERHVIIDFYRPTTSNEHPIGSVTCPCRPRAHGFRRALPSLCAFQRQSTGRSAWDSRRTEAHRELPRAGARLTTRLELWRLP
jgi:hypothetical protein